MTSPTVDREEAYARAVLDPHGGAQVTGRRIYSGLKGNLLKTRFAHLTQKEADKMMISAISSSSPKAQLIDYGSSGLEHFDSAFTLDMEYYDGDYAQRAGDLLIVGGNEDRRYSEEFDNSGHLEHRIHDLYLGWTPSFRWEGTMVLPDSFQVKNTLRDAERKCDFAYFVRVVHEFEDSITVITELKVLNPLIPAGRYSEYRDFLNEIDVLGKEVLVLEKSD